MLTITDLLPGNRVRLLSFGQTPLPYRSKLLSLGLTLGTEVLVLHVAPLGCPFLMEVRGISLTLRKEEACHLTWEYL